MKTTTHWTQDPSRGTTCDYRYEIVLEEKSGINVDGDFARKRSSAFEHAELWIQRNPDLVVAVYDRMARVGGVYEWRLVDGQWIVKSRKATS